MFRIAHFLPGTTLLLVGLTKLWTHTQSLEAFLAVRCGPDGISAGGHSAISLWSTMLRGHCWGCPVALTGAALIVAAAIVWAMPPAMLKSHIR